LKSDDDPRLPRPTLADFFAGHGRDDRDRTAAEPTPPPPITSYQKGLLAKLSAAAALASAAAKPELLKTLDVPAFRTKLGECCPELAALPAEQLLTELEAEFAVTEQVHNIRAGESGSDLTVPLGETLSFFPNLWDLKFIANGVACDEMQDDSEVNLFGFKPFAEPNVANATWAEVLERPIYIAFNQMRLANGNPIFGVAETLAHSTALRNVFCAFSIMLKVRVPARVHCRRGYLIHLLAEGCAADDLRRAGGHGDLADVVQRHRQLCIPPPWRLAD
jgi:hypothetical protein